MVVFIIIEESYVEKDEELPQDAPEEENIEIGMDIEVTRENDNSVKENSGQQLTKDGKIRDKFM